MVRLSIRKRLRKLKLLVLNPAQWSAEHYREKNSYDTVATTPTKWSEPRLSTPETSD